jgi:hypothetical protein
MPTRSTAWRGCAQRASRVVLLSNSGKRTAINLARLA